MTYKFDIPKIYELGFNINNKFVDKKKYKHSFNFKHHELYLQHIPGKPSFATDKVEIDLHYLTHIDAINHCAENLQGYQNSNFNVCDQYVHASEDIPLIKGGAVMLDIPNMLSVSQLPENYMISASDIIKCIEYQNINLEGVSIALIRTGAIKMRYTDEHENYFKKAPGIDLEAAKLLFERGITVMGADNFSFELYPCQNFWNENNKEGDFYPVHRFLLIKKGVYLLEHLNLEELSQDQIYKFFFVAAPTRFPGGTAALTNPIAFI